MSKGKCEHQWCLDTCNRCGEIQRSSSPQGKCGKCGLARSLIVKRIKEGEEHKIPRCLYGDFWDNFTPPEPQEEAEMLPWPKDVKTGVVGDFNGIVKDDSPLFGRQAQPREWERELAGNWCLACRADSEHPVAMCNFMDHFWLVPFIAKVETAAYERGRKEGESKGSGGSGC